MSRIIYWTLFGLAAAGLATCAIAGIWTGDLRWLESAWVPGALTVILFVAMPLFGDDL